MTSATMVTVVLGFSSGLCGEASPRLHPAGGAGPGLWAAVGSGAPQHGVDTVLVSGSDLGPELQNRNQAERSCPEPGLREDPASAQHPGQVHGSGVYRMSSRIHKNHSRQLMTYVCILLPSLLPTLLPPSFLPCFLPLSCLLTLLPTLLPPSTLPSSVPPPPYPVSSFLPFFLLPPPAGEHVLQRRSADV